VDSQRPPHGLLVCGWGSLLATLGFAAQHVCRQAWGVPPAPPTRPPAHCAAGYMQGSVPIPSPPLTKSFRDFQRRGMSDTAALLAALDWAHKQPPSRERGGSQLGLLPSAPSPRPLACAGCCCWITLGSAGLPTPLLPAPSPQAGWSLACPPAPSAWTASCTSSGHASSCGAPAPTPPRCASTAR
jgi:hypothetical protein